MKLEEMIVIPVESYSISDCRELRADFIAHAILDTSY